MTSITFFLVRKVFFKLKPVPKFRQALTIACSSLVGMYQAWYVLCTAFPIRVLTKHIPSYKWKCMEMKRKGGGGGTVLCNAVKFL